MAELEAYSGDVAEQVMSGTLAETASLHSSSADQSPRRPYASHDDASSVTDDLFAPPPQELPQPRPEGESRTASGSHSHDTITVSDMPIFDTVYVQAIQSPLGCSKSSSSSLHDSSRGLSRSHRSPFT